MPTKVSVPRHLQSIMKVLSTSCLPRGFSIIEVIIALAFSLVVITGALSSQLMWEYWTLTSQLASEAMMLNREHEGWVRQMAKQDFTLVSSTALSTIVDPLDPLLQSCRQGGLCYQRQDQVVDVSSCAKIATQEVFWKVGERYPTSSVTEVHGLFNSGELIQQGGDCVLELFPVRWLSEPPASRAVIATPPTLVTGLEVLGDRIYIVASSAPQLRIYDRPTVAASSPYLLSSSTVQGNRLNAIEVITDIGSGRTYAYVTQHTKSEQLLVLDVTNDEIRIVAARTLLGTDSLGSFPQGWRVVAYGKRLYVTTRETAGAELHIFSIANPSNPTEIPSGEVNLARTVNDMTVREQKVGGVMRRYLFLAASAARKEFSIIEVTGDIPIERRALDLSGTENALSIFLNGDILYLGREQSATGPELYQFRLSLLLAGSSTPLAESEVGAAVHTIKGVGPLLFLGTNKTNAELQVWQAAGSTWNRGVSNAARISAVAATRLAPLGLEVGPAFLYTAAQSLSQPEPLSVWSIP